MRTKFWQPLALAAICTFLFVASGVFIQSAHAYPIETTDIVSIPDNTTGSGNGTLDLRLFTFSGSEIDNEAGTFDGDNGNNTLPQGGSPETGIFAESYVTTAGELKDYYNLNFAPGSISELLVFLDLNETGGGAPNNTLARFDIVINPAVISGSPDPYGDVLGDTQAAIDQTYSGGTLLSWLDPEPAANLPVNAQGAGWADYAIFTGINPFSLMDTDVLLFNISMDLLGSGAEEFFLSGTYAPGDLTETPPTPAPMHPIPEPATISLLALGGIGLALRKRRFVRRQAKG